MGPPDVIFGINEAFQKDKSQEKINLSVGAYRDDEGKPFVLDCVTKAEEKIRAKKMNHEYAGIIGVPDFCRETGKLALGDNSEHIKNGFTVTVQTISGTGALRVGAELLKYHLNGSKVIYVPKPTWGNHNSVFKHSHLEIKQYNYYDPKTIGFDFKGCLDSITVSE